MTDQYDDMAHSKPKGWQAQGYFQGYPCHTTDESIAKWQRDNGVNPWLYDDNEVSTNIRRPCPKCGYISEKEDACLGHLPGVRNACCGHGLYKGSIEFDNGTIIEFTDMQVVRKEFNES